MKNSQQKIWGFLSKRSEDEKVWGLDIRKMKVLKCTCSPTPQTWFVATFLCRSLKSIFLSACVFLSLSSLPPPSLLSFLRGKANHYTLAEDILAWRWPKIDYIYQAQPFPYFKNWSLELQQISCVIYYTKRWKEASAAAFWMPNVVYTDIYN